MAFYDPKTIYDLSTMPKVEGWEESNGCDFVRFHWVLTERDQKKVDQHWRPDFYRHSLVNTKMALATHAGVGIPGWDPFYGMDREAMADGVGSPTDLCPEQRSLDYWDLSDQTLGTRIARQGIRSIKPTGLEDDPRVWRDPAAPKGDILGLLRGAAARYEQDLKALHEDMLAKHAAMKGGSWAQRASASRQPPTLEEARKQLEARRRSAPRWGQRIQGTWRLWEIEEIQREVTRQERVEAAWQRAEALAKSVIGPTWGGGT